MAAAPQDPQRYDVIVVLGARVAAGGRASPAMARRVRRGVALFHEGAAPRLLLSGGAVTGPEAEAAVMRELALAAGVPAERLLLEDRSRTTWENARFSARLMAEEGLEGALLVSDRLHLPRALLSFRRAGLRVEGRAAEEGRLEASLPWLAGQALYEAVALLRYLPRRR